MAAAAVVSVSMGVMKPVLEKLATLMGDEYKKIKGLQKEVTFLQSELSDMDALLEKMDLVDELDPQAKKWRKDIIEMSYDIEDRIGDFMHDVGEQDNKMGILRKASQFLRTFKDRRRLANEFQEIKTRVMEASKRRKRYTLDQCITATTPVVVDPRVSALYTDTKSLVGINAEKDELVNWAMDDKQQRLKFMAIVGFGGLGKTTLANVVYHQVGGQFDCKAFVSVSQKPNMIGLFNSLLSQLRLGTYSHDFQMHDLIDKLRGHLQDKRYFIVIDDLWNIQESWNIIECAFPRNSQFSSRVIITTRDENVARLCCKNNGQIYHMKPLSELDSRKLFFNRIFGSEDSCPPQLMKPSCEILKKCGGLPLAIITMASVLACQRTRSEGQWESIQHSIASNFATKSKYDEMMYILDLSYKFLPRQLKSCFLYLGSYPEDHDIEKVHVVSRWVAEGFVSNSDGQDVWDVAESYYNELVNRSLIQPKYDDGTFFFPLRPRCRVHDMLLELIVKRCKEDNFLSLINGDLDAEPKGQDKVIRRLTVVGFGGAKEVAQGAVGNPSQIRSLAMLGSNWRPPLLELKFVRVLFIDLPLLRRQEIDLTDINQLSQLRYLFINACIRSAALHHQIKGLRLLETLDLSRATRSGFTFEIVDAPRLSHLAVSTSSFHMQLPHWIGRFKLLRTLSGFILPADSLERIIGLGELAALSDLQLGSPYRCTPPLREATWMAALGASLEKLHNLRRLVVTYNWHFDIAWCADALSSLSPPFHNLEQLDLRYWTFSRFPKWIGHLQNLRELWIGTKQITQEDVLTMGTQLPCLVILWLRIPGTPTGRILIGGSTGFPAVELFCFDCNRTSYLTFEAGAMPRLRELDIHLYVDEWDRAAPGGLQHLSRLEKIEATKTFYGIRRIDQVEAAALIRDVFQGAVDALPTRPAFTLGRSEVVSRPTEEDDYLKQLARNDPVWDRSASTIASRFLIETNEQFIIKTYRKL